MLDPRAQKKGGFGAFVAREQERHDVREAEHAKDAPASSDGVAPPARPTADAAADGAPAR